MQRLLPILAGAGFTVGVSTAAGLILVRRLRLPFDRLEEWLFSFISGSAILSFLVFLLCLIHQARLPVFLIGGAVILIWAALTPGEKLTSKCAFGRQKWLFLAPICPILIVYLANTLAPEVSPDGSGYHLGNVVRMYGNHGFVWDYHSIYSYLSQGLEMLFLVAYSIGGMPAAATVHFTFLCCLGLLIACYGRRYGFPDTGMFAAVLVFASPVVGLVGVSAYNDVALATCSFAVFYSLQVICDGSNPNLLIISGLIAGFCYDVKYPGVLVLPVALVLLKGKGIARFGPAALVMMIPWLLRNWLWLGNPLAPFFNRWFPNPFYSADAEAAYLRDLRSASGGIWDLVVSGSRLPGFLGPVFLLTPFALLALRNPHGRRLLLGAAILSIPVFLNPGARFLIPALPFVAVAMGLAMRNSPAVLPILAIFHGILALPAVMPSYCAPWAWRIKETPLRVAVGIDPEGPYITRHLPDFWLKEALERTVPKTETIYSLAGLPEAYIDRRVVVAYESLEGLKGGDEFHYLVLEQHSNLPGLTILEQRNGKAIYRRN